MTAALLEVSGLSKSFGGLQAVQELDVSVHRGQTVGLIGPNGAGKTTVLSLISGFIPPDAGTVVLDGQDVTGHGTADLVQRGLVRTFQSTSLYPELTVRDNLLTALQAVDRTGLLRRIALGPLLGRPDRLQQQADAILESVSLAHLDAVVAGSLPYGSQRLLGLAMSVALEPQVLLLDEPAAGMNAEEREELVALLRRLHEQGSTIVLIEHDVPLVAAVCDRVVVLSYGQRIAEGTPQEIQQDQAVIDAYLGSDDA